jgi:hypothetical protein
MIPDRLGGEAQEVDVLIEEPFGQYRLLIGVECRNSKRPATIEWVQQMRGKHLHRTDKLVLLSRSGFSEAAIDEAQRHGIVTMALAEASRADWTTIVNKLMEVFLGQFSFDIRNGYAVLAEDYGSSEEPLISAAEQIYSSDGLGLGPVGEIARERLRQPDAGKDLMELFYANQDRNRATATFQVPEGSYLIDAAGTKWRVRAIKLEIECQLRMTPIPLRHGVVGTEHVAWGQTTAGDEQMFFVTSEQRGRPSRTTLRIANPTLKTEQLVEMVDETFPKGLG